MPPVAQLGRWCTAFPRSLSTKIVRPKPTASKKLPHSSKPHLELSSLPKSPSSHRSLRFSGVLPGTCLSITSRASWSSKTLKILDSSHPSTLETSKTLPRYTCPLFTLRAYPYALLSPFDKSHYPFANPSAEDKSAKRIAFGMACMVPKKRVHSSAVIRVRVKTRMKEALRLVVTQGACSDSEGNIVMNGSEVGEEHWVLKNWVYIFQPTLEMYKHPPEGVITEVRAALRRIKDQGQSLELRWANPVYMQPLAPWKPNTLKTGVKKTRTSATRANKIPSKDLSKYPPTLEGFLDSL